MSSRLFVRELMTDEVKSVGAQESVDHAYQLMNSAGVRHLPVVDALGEVIGILTDRDIANHITGAADRLPVGEMEELLRSVRIAEIMTIGVETIEPNEEAIEAGKIMLENKLGCLPVVEGGRLVGIITQADFVKYFIEMQEDLYEVPARSTKPLLRHTAR